ncbi:hypothetical protein ABBQ38_002974 [Trebouxia sp. C0009 RCD-2024]
MAMQAKIHLPAPAGDDTASLEYALLLKGYEDECLSTDKQHAETMLASLSGPHTSTSDSPVVTPVAESQPSSSSSCLNGGGPSQQSGRTMESSATASHDLNHHHAQPQRLSTEALSPFSKGKAQHSTDAHDEPSSLRAGAPTGAMVAPGPEQHSRGTRRSATPSAEPASSPRANGNSCTVGQHHTQQACQAEASAAEQPPAAPSHQPCRAATPPAHSQARSTDRAAASVPIASMRALSAANTAQASNLPSGAYMIPYPAATLSASPQSSPIHVPPMHAASNPQQASTQQPPPNQRQPAVQQAHQQSHPPQQQAQQHHHRQQQQLLQQQLLHQQRYQLMMQAQAVQQQQMQKQASLQSQQQQQQQQQQALMGKPPLQQSFGVQAPFGQQGMKRSASGEAAGASAKKQKTSPLVAYQQAQEHLRNQTARPGGQTTEQTRLAEDLLSSIAPRLGPILSVPSTFLTTHAKDIELSLRSGVHTSVSWSLNVLTVLSFNAPQHVLLSDHHDLLQALLQVVSVGLEEETCPVVDYDECLTPAERLLPPRRQPKPGEPQGWWWEREEGLLAPQPGLGWAFTHACCAGNILRNLAMEPRNLLPLTGHAAVEALVHCLAARRTQPCPHTNDLALNALDCLHKITGQQGMLLPALPPQLHSALLAELCHAMAAHDTPLRVRMSVPGVLHRLAAAADNITPLAHAAGDGKLLMLEQLSCLLRTGTAYAQQQVQQEVAGSCGPAGIWAEDMPPKGQLAMALSLQAEALAATAKACAELVKHSEQMRQAVAGNSHLMVSLIQLLLSSHMQYMDAWHSSTKTERLKDGLHRYIYGLFRSALQYSTAVLINVATLPTAQHKLRAYEMQLVELAMAESPQADWVAALLNKIVHASD